MNVTKIFCVLATVGVLAGTLPAQALRNKSDSREPAHSSSGAIDLGLGVSGTAQTGAASSPELSLWLAFNDKNALQVLFGIQSTAPFAFNAGALYKNSIVGTWSQGFHLGGGAILGTRAGGGFGATVFAATITGLAGLHFQVPGVEHVLIQADAGPAIDIVDGSASFRVGAVGGLLGLSLHYVF